MKEQERWQVSESAARKYELFVASWFGSWSADLVERAELDEGWNVLDLACGTGTVTRCMGPIVGPTGAITASDLNLGMLDEARRHAVDGAPVEWRQADAQALPFDDNIFDAVLCQQGLQFVPEPATAVAEMHRVLHPGGVAAVSTWRGAEHNPYITALADGLRTHLSEDAAQTMLTTCRLANRQTLADLFTDAGFAAVEVHTVTLDREPVDAVQAVMGNLAALPIADQIQTMDAALQGEMVDQIVGSLAGYITNGGLTAPSSAHIAVAHA